MASYHAPACVFQETRLNLDPAGPIVNISISSPQSTSVVSRDSPKRRKLDRRPAPQDEASYIASHFASDGSIHFRSVEDPAAPASILWRVLENGTVLELQAVDLSIKAKEPRPASATLRFSFRDSIIPAGVLLAKPTNSSTKSDTLILYIVTQRPDIYRLTLKKEAFTTSTYFQDDSIRSQWLTKCTPSILSYRHPYNLYLKDADELWVSLNDGGLVRLQWNDNRWHETRFADGNWKGSLMGMIRRTQPLVKYGNLDLDARSAVTMLPSPSGKLVWTVCLDHTLRAWNIETGKSVFIEDLVGDEERDMQRPPEQPMEADQPPLLQIHPVVGKASSDEYQLVVYSPSKQSFTFWLVDESDPSDPQRNQQHASLSFAPPVDDLLNVSGWRLDQYSLTPPHDRRSHHWTLWLLVRSAGKSNLLHIKFNPSSKVAEHRATWEGGWSTVHPGSGSVQELNDHIDNPIAVDVDVASEPLPATAERWIEFIFKPGQFTTDLLETALEIFKRGQPKLGRSSLMSSRATLVEDICTTVGASSVMQTSAVVKENFAAYEKDIALQWSIFYGVVRDLQKQKERPINLAYQTHGEMPWIVSADQVAPVREVSLLECLWQNKDAFSGPQPAKQSHNQAWECLRWRDSDVDAGKLLHALSVFTSSFSNAVLLQLRDLVVTDYLFQDESVPIEERMRAIYNSSGLDELTDENYDKVAEAINLVGSFSGLSNTPFQIILQALSDGTAADAPASDAVAPYGMKALSQGARDALNVGQEVLLGIIAFSIFTAIELDPEDVSNEFTAAEIYEAAAQPFLEHALLDILSSSAADKENGPLLEDIVGIHIAKPSEHESERALLTKWIRKWTFTLVMTDHLRPLATNVLAHMIKKGCVRNAGLLMKFLPTDSWSFYVKARYHLAVGEPEEAAEDFISAAEGLAIGFDIKATDRAKLLQSFEQLHFSEGFLLYYQHILNLFETSGHLSYVVDFAHLALEQADANDRSTTASRTDILSRLFTASIQLLRFEEAFEALVAYTDHALRRPALSNLLDALIASSRVQLLSDLPFPADLKADADAHLATLAASPSALTTTLSKSVTGPAYDAEAPLLPAHQILYAFRAAHGDFRGAAEALWEHIQQLRLLRAQGLRGADVDAELSETYLACINSLTLVEESMRWLLVRPVVLPDTNGKLGKGVVSEEQASREQRALVSLDDVRSEWQKFLDWQSDLAAGRYALGTEVDGDEEGDYVDDSGLNGLPALTNGFAPPGAMDIDPFVN